jgi:DNA modification methylase
MPESITKLGDCMDFMRELPDNYADLAVCDPPYGINYDVEQNKQAEQGRISNEGKWNQ